MERLMLQLPLEYTRRQKLLELNSMSEQYEYLMKVLVTEIEVGKIRREFQDKVKADIDKNQKEYILREQMKIIRKELGEEDVVGEADETTRKNWKSWRQERK